MSLTKIEFGNELCNAPCAVYLWGGGGGFPCGTVQGRGTQRAGRLLRGAFTEGLRVVSQSRFSRLQQVCSHRHDNGASESVVHMLYTNISCTHVVHKHQLYTCCTQTSVVYMLYTNISCTHVVHEHQLYVGFICSLCACARV